MELSLKIITPQGTIGPYICDSIHLNVSDDLEGKGGGSYGIRQGHAKAMLSLQAGILDAYLNENQILLAKVGCGFASVEQNVVNVVVETCQIEKDLQ